MHPVAGLAVGTEVWVRRPSLHDIIWGRKCFSPFNRLLRVRWRGSQGQRCSAYACLMHYLRHLLIKVVIIAVLREDFCIYLVVLTIEGYTHTHKHIRITYRQVHLQERGRERKMRLHKAHNLAHTNSLTSPPLDDSTQNTNRGEPLQHIPLMKQHIAPWHDPESIQTKGQTNTWKAKLRQNTTTDTILLSAPQYSHRHGHEEMETETRGGDEERGEGDGDDREKRVREEGENGKADEKDRYSDSSLTKAAKHWKQNTKNF